MHISRESEIKSELCSLQPLPHVGLPVDIASAVAFVADNDKAAFVTGADFNVDGGISLACAFQAENKE